MNNFLNNNDEVFEEVKFLAENIKNQMDRKNNEDYVPNTVQQTKLLMLTDLLCDKAQDIGDAYVEPIELIPKECCGGTNAYFTFFALNGEEQVKKFAKEISWCSALSLHAAPDGRVCISFTVPDTYRKKK